MDRTFHPTKSVTDLEPSRSTRIGKGITNFASTSTDPGCVQGQPQLMGQSKSGCLTAQGFYSVLLLATDLRRDRPLAVDHAGDDRAAVLQNLLIDVLTLALERQGDEIGQPIGHNLSRPPA